MAAGFPAGVGPWFGPNAAAPVTTQAGMFGVPGVGPVVGRWGAGSAPAVQAGLYGVLALCGIFGRWGAGTATPPPTPTQAMGGGVRLAKLVVRDIRDDEDAIFLMLAAVADLDS